MSKEVDTPYEKLQTGIAEGSLPNVSMAQSFARRPVRHYFGFSLFSAICLCPATGLIALAYSLKSSAKADVNFHDKASLYSRRAFFWNMVSIVLAILSVILVVMIFYRLGHVIEERNMAMASSRFAYNVPYPEYYNGIDNTNRVIASITNN